MLQRLAPASVGYPLQMIHCCQPKSLGMSKPSKNMMHAIANALLKKLKKWQKKERRYTNSSCLVTGPIAQLLSCFCIHTTLIIRPHTAFYHIFSAEIAAMQCKENEEKWEKKVEETMGQKATGSDAKAAKVDKSLNKNALSSTTSTDDVLLDDIPEGEQATAGS
jgi:hypothetical protein